MTWTKLDDNFADDAKIREVGPLGAWLYTATLNYATRLNTDGWVPDDVVAGRVLTFRGCYIRADRRYVGASQIEWQKALVAARLWHPGAHPCPSCMKEQGSRARTGGIWIHDFWRYQFLKAEVEERRDSRSKRGRRGAEARWGDPGSMATAMPQAHAQASESGMHTAMQQASPQASPSGMPRPARPSRPDPKGNASRARDGEPEIPDHEDASGSRQQDTKDAKDAAAADLAGVDEELRQAGYAGIPRLGRMPRTA